jgi:hypothetical protein
MDNSSPILTTEQVKYLDIFRDIFIKPLLYKMTFFLNKNYQEYDSPPVIIGLKEFYSTYGDIPTPHTQKIGDAMKNLYFLKSFLERDYLLLKESIDILHFP